MEIEEGAAAEGVAKEVAEETIRSKEETLRINAEDKKEQEHVVHAHEDAEDLVKRRKVDVTSGLTSQKTTVEMSDSRVLKHDIGVRSSKSCSEEPDGSTPCGQIAKGEEKEIDTPDPFYKVQATNLKDSPDPRAKRELDLQTLAARIRDFPTIPADPDNATEVWPAALSDEIAIELPTVHCSFRGCSWCGQADDERDLHILTVHKEDLLPIAIRYPSVFQKKHVF